MPAAVAVADLAEARAALEAARLVGVGVALLSPVAASASIGVGWFRELAALAAAEATEVECAAILDCGDRAGDAMAALRGGLKQIVYDGPRADALADIAGQLGATLHMKRPDAFVFAPGGPDIEACARWLAARAE